MEPRAFLRTLFDAAVAAADPAVVLPAHLPEPPRGRTVVVGAGKASAAMGLALERHWPVRAPGRPGDHRPDAHQYQRFPRRAGVAALTAAVVARPGPRRYGPRAFWRDGRAV